MASATLGANISQVEVTNVSKHGFWLLLDDEELFLPFAEFPWFKECLNRNTAQRRASATSSPVLA